MKRVTDFARAEKTGSPTKGNAPKARQVSGTASRTGRRMGVASYFGIQIARLIKSRRFGTARNYQRTLNSWKRFAHGRELSFSTFSRRTVEEYGRFLTDRGVMRNTFSFYMRTLRSIYNKAVDESLVEQSFPFRGVYTGVDHTSKRAVNEQIIAHLRLLDLRDSQPLEWARDLFMFSFYTRGMAFVDIAYLRKSDIINGMLRYTRRKTGQTLCVSMEPCMYEIIDRYARFTRYTIYLFPILKSREPATAYSQYQTALNYYNRLLKQLAERMGLKNSLTSYTSRHSWATAARNHNIPLSVISAGMGHTSERTTQIYLAQIENSIIDQANRDLLDSLRSETGA